MTSEAPQDVAALRELAEKATKGPWTTLRGFRLHVVPADQADRPLGGAVDPRDDAKYARPICEVREESRFDGWEKYPHRRFDRNRNFADAQWIAAASPTVVLGLLDQNDRLWSALRTYGVHGRNCAMVGDHVTAIVDCTCGFRSVLRGSGAEEAARNE